MPCVIFVITSTRVRIWVPADSIVYWARRRRKEERDHDDEGERTTVKEIRLRAPQQLRRHCCYPLLGGAVAANQGWKGPDYVKH